ncbi:MAG: hypothetical protein WCC28_02390 [Mycobacterium sp.]|uniref:hypothetical protein n=1 Tax=Mycobacterium sp. TaxID=1785 RepID=UPI003C70B23E
MTELRSRSVRVLPGMAALAIAVLSGCDRTIDGVAAWTGGSAQSATGSHHPTTGDRTPAPGIETTLPEHIPPNAFVCFPGPAGIGIGTVAQVSDPAAPRITLTVPEAWTSEPGQGDVALSLSGPDGMTGEVTITVTARDPASAFADYVATLARSKPDFQVDTVGVKFCGYSSQKLSGTFRGPQGAVEFADRITHIWTNTGQYLVAVHLEGAQDAPGFGAAKAALMQEFSVVIP